MDFLKNLASTATSSILAATGLVLPFTLDNKVGQVSPLWILHHGKIRETGESVSIFVHDSSVYTHQSSAGDKRELLRLAKQAAHHLRTTKHPDVLRVVDVVENESSIYLATQRVSPIGSVQNVPLALLCWNMWGVCKALGSLKDSIHGSLVLESLFMTASGQWKLAGMETVHREPKNPQNRLLPSTYEAAPPESHSDIGQNYPIHAYDAYSLGLLLCKVFGAQVPSPGKSVNKKGEMSNRLWECTRRLLHPQPTQRLSIEQFNIAAAEPSFWPDPNLIQLSLDLENFGLWTEEQRQAWTTSSFHQFPSDVLTHWFAPALLDLLKLNLSPNILLPLALKYTLEQPEILIPALSSLYSSPDRAMRLALLTHAETYAPLLNAKTTASLWPALSQGFTDALPIMREQTLKSMHTFAPSLADRVKNGDLLRFLAKLQVDTEAAIRLQAIELITQLADPLKPQLSIATRKKVVLPACARAVKDPIAATRIAGLLGLIASAQPSDSPKSDIFEPIDIATGVLPVCLGCMLDRDSTVRQHATKAVDSFLLVVRNAMSLMPETSRVETPSLSENTEPPKGSSLLSTWALSAVATSTSLASTVLGDDVGLRPSSAPPSSIPARQPLHSGGSAASASYRRPSDHASSNLNMKLGSKATSKSTLSELMPSVADAFQEEVAEDTWGIDDPWADPAPTFSNLSLKPSILQSTLAAKPILQPQTAQRPATQSAKVSEDDWASFDDYAPVKTAPVVQSKADKAAELAKRQEERRLKMRQAHSAR